MEGDELPVLPYAGGSGSQPVDASREREARLDASGKTTHFQRRALEYIGRKNYDGATWEELGMWLRIHHGSASSVLSVLHKAHLICRLKERRNECRVYVLPEYLDGREHDEQGRKQRLCPHCGEAL